MNDVMHDGQHGDEWQIHPAIRSHVRTDAEFRSAVQAGIASAQTGPNRDLETVAADIRRSILQP